MRVVSFSRALGQAAFAFLLLGLPVVGRSVNGGGLDDHCFPFGITFDIDGVLSKEGEPLPYAADVIKLLYEEKVPFTFLTNGGGMHETERAAGLTKTLGVNITEDRCIQSHTPYKDLASKFRHKTILVVGQDPCKAKEIMHKYGYGTVITVGALHRAYPELWPFVPRGDSHNICDDEVDGLPKPIDLNDTDNSLKIDGAFVINDPRHWSLDLQILHDLMVSRRGIIGTVSRKNGNKKLKNNGWQQDNQPMIYFSASDLEFSAKWQVPRFGQGAFLTSLEGIWKRKTNGAKWKSTIYGKPMFAQYEYVENREKQLQRKEHGKHCAFKRNYMIGDSPESDIRGAQEYKSKHGTEWIGVLVKTGVWDGVSEPSVRPRYNATDVRAAIALIGELEGMDLEVPEEKESRRLE